MPDVAGSDVKSNWTQGVVPVAAALLLLAAAALQPALLRLRAGSLPSAVSLLDDAPPLMRFTTVVLGGFRGILADIFWLRVVDLQDDGAFFELIQLGDWITRLEPRNTEVWTYQAWNMAYNISVAMARPEDRWRWVRAGLELLRDEGRRYNATDPQIYAEIAWMYQHKIGGMTDDQNRYYKLQLAGETHRRLGGGRLNADNPEGKARTLAFAEAFRMDPQVLLEVDRRYGPLDWRVPEMHSLYWAYEGTRRRPGAGQIVCNRLVFQSMADAFLEGHLRFDPDTSTYVEGPRLDRLEMALVAYREAIVRFPNEATYRDAYRTFLATAVVVLHAFGNDLRAAELLADLQHMAPGMPARVEDLVADLRRLGFTQASASRLTAWVCGLLVRARTATDKGNPSEAERLKGEAREAYADVLRGIAPGEHERLGIPSFEQIEALAQEFSG